MTATGGHTNYSLAATIPQQSYSVDGVLGLAPLSQPFEAQYAITSGFVPFQFGSIFDIAASLSLSSDSAQYGWTATAEMPYLYLEILGSDMAPVSAQVWSESGYAYPSSVPEPTSVSLLALVGASFVFLRVLERRNSV